MASSSTFLSASITKKQLVALTGLLLSGFLVTHLAGNLLILVGHEVFNKYAYNLTSTPLIYVAEAILLAIFLTHIFLAVKLNYENNRARPQKYYIKQKTGRGSTFASSTMPYTGTLVLIFLVFHILHIKFGPTYTITYQGQEMRDLHRTVIEYFQNPLAVTWYIFSMVVLGIHLSHGFWSAFQSIGFNHDLYTPRLRKLSFLFAAAITFGFSVLPLYSYFQGGFSS